MLNISIRNEVLERMPADIKDKIIETYLERHGMDVSKGYIIECREDDTVYSQYLQPLEYVYIKGVLK